MRARGPELLCCVYSVLWFRKSGRCFLDVIIRFWFSGFSVIFGVFG